MSELPVCEATSHGRALGLTDAELGALFRTFSHRLSGPKAGETALKHLFLAYLDPCAEARKAMNSLEFRTGPQAFRALGRAELGCLALKKALDRGDERLRVAFPDNIALVAAYLLLPDWWKED